MPWVVLIHPDAEIELSKIPARERAAMDTALGKLREIGPALGHPHTSNVQSARNLREVRPRQGRSPWRGLYRQIGQVFVVGGIGPEATVDPKAFKRCVRLADDRLDDVEEDT